MKILNAIVSVLCFLACMALVGFITEPRDASPLQFFIIISGFVSSATNLLILFFDSEPTD